MRGNVLAKMLSTKQGDEVEAVFRDSMLYRLNQQPGTLGGELRGPSFGWVLRLNSLGLISRCLSSLWQEWWGMGTRGRALATLQYCSGLMYFADENPFSLQPWASGPAGGSRIWWLNDSHVFDQGWPCENVDFVRGFLTAERVVKAVQDATAALTGAGVGGCTADDL